MMNGIDSGPTKGPWAVDPEAEELVIGPDGKTIAIVTVPFSGDKEYDRKVQLANTRRIVACVNALIDVDTETLELCAGPPKYIGPKIETTPSVAPTAHIGCLGLPESD